MTSTPIHDDLTVAYELRVLDNLLDDECRCDSESHRNFECSVAVVARSIRSCDGLAKNWCLNRVRQHDAERDRYKCANCPKTATDCWRIIPV